MWKQSHRQRLTSIEKQTKRYPSDLTDAEWLAIEPVLPRMAKTGRRRSVDMREVLNAIRYLVRGGQAWRLLPHDFPPWQTVYYYLRRWQAEGVWEHIHHAVLVADRERAGRGASPTAAIIDSQS
jgi:transposase